eukprot:TRINITY_DN13551_c0_g2_i3.p2 TRINITY_DN13551_c0_g2~~TRINITY_DN13551_c0_g2_i3.p2  ORF type:complete len:143 (+),score=80.50 TRINITY_DN13551_c0_g2_i3:33-431(+)
MGVDASLAMIIKQRARANAVERMDLVGSVDGCDAIIVDDMIDTAGTLVKAAGELKKFGARRVFAFATHGLFNGQAIQLISDSVLEKVVVTNTVPVSESKRIPKIEYLSVGPLLADAIRCIHSKQSVSALFNN